MKNLAKILTVILILCLAVPTCFASQLGVVNKDSTDAISVDIKLDSIPEDIQKISAITIEYTYDSEKLTFKSGLSSAEILYFLF